MYEFKQIITYETKLNLFTCTEIEILIISIKHLILKLKTTRQKEKHILVYPLGTFYSFIDIIN